MFDALGSLLQGFEMAPQPMPRQLKVTIHQCIDNRTMNRGDLSDG